MGVTQAPISSSPDVAALAEALIACPSVTPAAGLVFDCLERQLAPLGFAVHRFVAGEAPDGPVENLFAIRTGPVGSRHLAFAGHLDVVPPGEGWASAPFAPERRGLGADALLYGRGAVDMKGAIAAMVAAVATVPATAGTISFIITGDEEGPARFGTLALIDWMRANGHAPDLCLVGEPTSVHRLGDMIKLGRRGSVNIWLEVVGAEGHVAYPHLADNPVPRLVALLAELDRQVLDTGTDWFQPSNLEITDITVGNVATNALISEIAARHGATARAVVSGEAFLTPPGEFSAIVRDAILVETGLEAEISTTGGTSDARFLKNLCPVIEFGLSNATMHKRDEAVAVADLSVLARIYARIAEAALVSG